jgi:hypothetical protein
VKKVDRSYNFVAEDRSGTYIKDRIPNSRERADYKSKGYKPQIDVSKCRNRIKEHRTRAGISLATVAGITGQHITTVARHETRTQRIPPPILEMYAQLYQVDIKRLLVKDDNI